MSRGRASSREVGRSGLGASDPEEGLADGKGAENGGVGWVGVEGAPEGGVVGAEVGAGGEEEGGAAAGEVVEEVGVCAVGPGVAAFDEGDVARHGDVEAGAILQLVLPECFKAGGEEIAGGGEEVEVEEGVAVGVGGGELVGESAFAGDLGAESDGFELVAEAGEGGVVGEEAGVSRALEQPGAADMVLAVAGEAGQAGDGEPLEEVSEPGFDRGEVLGGEGFGAGQKGDGLGDLCQGGGFGDAVGVAGRVKSFGGVVERGLHAGCGRDEPGLEVLRRCLGVAGGAAGIGRAGEEVRGGEGGDGEGELEEGVAVGVEGRRGRSGIGRRRG